jgi:hypothetical protein
VKCFVTFLSVYGEELLEYRPTPRLKNHPLSALCEYLFNIFAATGLFLYPQPDEALRRDDTKERTQNLN